MKTFHYFPSALLSLVLVSCSSSSDSNGTAPTVDTLTYSPTSGAVGAQVTITGQINFNDPDGDVTQIAIDGSAPGQTTETNIGTTAAKGDIAAKQGLLKFEIVFQGNVAGTYNFSIYAIDSKGNSSNKLPGTITLQ